MFGIDSSELAIIALVALLVIGPKDLPRVMRQVGQWLAKGRAMSRHVRSGFDAMMREAELEEMQAQWAAQNEAIMKATALPDLGVGGAAHNGAAPGGVAHAYDSEDWTSNGPAMAALEAPAATPAVPEKPRRSRAKPPVDASPSAQATPTDGEAAPAAKAPRKRSPRAKASPPVNS